jgi:hypothetical protein
MNNTEVATAVETLRGLKKFQQDTGADTSKIQRKVLENLHAMEAAEVCRVLIAGGN